MHSVTQYEYLWAKCLCFHCSSFPCIGTHCSTRQLSTFHVLLAQFLHGTSQFTTFSQGSRRAVSLGAFVHCAFLSCVMGDHVTCYGLVHHYPTSNTPASKQSLNNLIRKMALCQTYSWSRKQKHCPVAFLVSIFKSTCAYECVCVCMYLVYHILKGIIYTETPSL